MTTKERQRNTSPREVSWGWRGRKLQSSIEPSFLPFWKLTQNTEGQMCSGGCRVKSKCMCVGVDGGEQKGWKGKQD